MNTPEDIQTALAFKALDNYYQYRAENCLFHSRLPNANIAGEWRQYHYWQGMRTILQSAQARETFYLFFAPNNKTLTDEEKARIFGKEYKPYA